MRIDVNGVRLFFDVEGAKLVPDGPRMREKPALVLLHGGPGMDGAYWKPWASALSDICQIIYVDQRGAGRSDAGPKESWTFDQWGDDVRAFCEALEIERPIVCGSSFGGEVAMAYATRHPAHPGKLIILSAAPRLNMTRIVAVFERLGGRKARDAARAFWSSGMTPESGANYARYCVPLYFRTPQDPDHDARSILSADLTEWYLRDGGPAQTCDFTAGLARIQCPTLVMGGEDDPVTTIDDMADIAAAIPQHLVRFERIPNCGHGPFFDAPDRTLDVIREFITGEAA
jgi:proline iminopeptidase